MAERTGLAAVVADAGAGQALPIGEAEQMDMLGLALPQDRRPRGRPAGQRNVRVQRTADYLLARYRDPLEGLVAMAAMGVDELASALGCTKLEAFGEKRQCATAAIPYLHSRMPIAVNVSVDLPMLVMADPRDFAAAETVEGEIEEIQVVSEGENGKV